MPGRGRIAPFAGPGSGLSRLRANGFALPGPPSAWTMGGVTDATCRILVIEADAALCRTLERVLRVRSAEVVSFSSSEPARALLESFSPDLVLIDAASMTDPLLAALRRAPRPPTIIGMSDEPRIERPEVAAWLRKPLTARRLDDAIDAALAFRQRGG